MREWAQYRANCCSDPKLSEYDTYGDGSETVHYYQCRECGARWEMTVTPDRVERADA